MKALENLVRPVLRQYAMACFADRIEPANWQEDRDHEQIQIFLAEFENVIACGQRESGIAQDPPDVLPGARAELEAFDFLRAALRAEWRQRYHDAAAESDRRGED